MQVDPNIVTTHTAGKEGFLVGLCEAMGVRSIMDQGLTCQMGRPPEIPYGVLAMMMIVNMSKDHKPMYRLWEFYNEFEDLEGIFHCPIDYKQINDDRFGGFLDLLHEAGAREIFSRIAANAVVKYGIEVTSINFDTTSKVMWGEYEAEEGKRGVIEINFGHSKDKRDDKRQLKIGVGCANGIVMDGEILSGNKDDKTYNTDTLKRLDGVITNLKINKDTLYYIADSALFSSDNLAIAKERGLKLITRIPDNVTIAKRAIAKAVDHLEDLESYVHIKANAKESEYKIMQEKSHYEGHNLSMVVCYSSGLKPTKEKTIQKAVQKEASALNKMAKSLDKRVFACEKDAKIEMKKIKKKQEKNARYHQISFSIETNILKKRGRPFKNQSDEPVQTNVNYILKMNVCPDEHRIERSIDEGCCFVLCSNDSQMAAVDILKEYKTQDSVEKKFQQLKSPHFVNSIYLDSPRRIEAFSYLMLISMLLLSVAEYVVRRGLSQDDKQIIGPGKIKMKRPTQRAIYDIFFAVSVRVIRFKDRPWQRSYALPLNESLRSILQYLHIPEDTFIRGST